MSSEARTDESSVGILVQATGIQGKERDSRKGGQEVVKPEKINQKETQDGDEAQGADTPISGNCNHPCAVSFFFFFSTELLCTHYLIPFNPMK